MWAALATALSMQNLSMQNLWILLLGVFVSGLVRGFSGFGTALVYLPIAGQILPPFEALTTLITMDLIGPIPNIPAALRRCHPGDVARLSVGGAIALPGGVWMLSLIPAEAFRYGVSLVALTLLGVLLAGLRYRGRLGPSKVVATGVASGFLAGSVGLPGPPVILFYMASPHPATAIRANIMVFLLGSDIMMLGVMFFNGYLVGSAVVLGLVLAPLYLLANLAGAAIFQPRFERAYRATAYLIIAGSAIAGLPLFD